MPLPGYDVSVVEYRASPMWQDDSYPAILAILCPNSTAVLARELRKQRGDADKGAATALHRRRLVKDLIKDGYYAIPSGVFLFLIILALGFGFAFGVHFGIWLALVSVGFVVFEALRSFHHLRSIWKTYKLVDDVSFLQFLARCIIEVLPSWMAIFGSIACAVSTWDTIHLHLSVYAIHHHVLSYVISHWLLGVAVLGNPFIFTAVGALFAVAWMLNFYYKTKTARAEGKVWKDVFLSFAFFDMVNSLCLVATFGLAAVATLSLSTAGSAALAAIGITAVGHAMLVFWPITLVFFGLACLSAIAKRVKPIRRLVAKAAELGKKFRSKGLASLIESNSKNKARVLAVALYKKINVHGLDMDLRIMSKIEEDAGVMAFKPQHNQAAGETLDGPENPTAADPVVVDPSEAIVPSDLSDEGEPEKLSDRVDPLLDFLLQLRDNETESLSYEYCTTTSISE
ncbi:MAG: hypothetical protein JXR42_04790 [Gammaproteobacteria bacterium]|nr:hypothetical protein [Gammaproteobacteria bacterium]